MTKSKKQLKIAVVTPTYQRDHFLLQTLAYIKQQTTSAEVHWFILDDSPHISQHTSIFKAHDFCDYHWLNHKLNLGNKRNQLNQMALKWGADIICSMDDDDWYGSTYLEDMSEILLLSDDHLFAGSGDDYYYEVAKNRILKIPAVREFSSCNGVLCYKSSVLTTRQYDENAKFAEEGHFLQNAKIMQHPNIQSVHLALAHQHNTVTKKNYCYDDRYQVDLSLNDFPMTQTDQAFYLNLHHQVTAK